MRTIDDVFRQSWTLNFPRAIQIETISLCNARCTFCPYVETAQMFPVGRMSDEVYNKILLELEKHQPQLVAPYLNNEPLLDKSIIARIRVLREALPYAFIDLSTNGSALTAAVAEELVDQALGIDEIKINFPTTDAEEYERIMHLNYNRTLTNVREFIQMARKKGFKGRYRVICVGKDISEEEQIFWADTGILAKQYTKISRGGIIKTSYESEPRIKGCKYNREREWLHIINTGEIVLCCMDWYRQHILGDIRKDSIETIWKSAAYQAIRNRIKDSTDEGFICNKCEWSIPYEGQ
jgi:radical SAM protein with 4Fe4S-binding SPASM domain